MPERKFMGIAAKLADLVRGDRFVVADRAEEELGEKIIKAQKRLWKTGWEGGDHVVLDLRSIRKARERSGVARRRAIISSGFNTLP